ncbi:MAG TPA: tRNA-dihydrouridine synthase, partial [Pirellulaceae bacterium]
INFGCPVKKVLGHCRGGFHLSQPDVALDIVARTRAAVPPRIPLTVKMRRGMDDSAKSRDDFFRILEGAFALGVDAITVHGRTVQQRYVGPSRWEFLTEVKRLVGSRVILGSGDLFTPQDCLEMMRRTGVDGVSVARGAIGNPWIFGQARALAETGCLPAPPRLDEQAAVLREHYRLAEELYGVHGSPLMRKFGIKYAASHPDYPAVREAFSRVRNRPDWDAILDTHYAQPLPGRYPDPQVHRVQGSCAVPREPLCGDVA